MRQYKTLQATVARHGIDAVKHGDITYVGDYYRYMTRETREIIRRAYATRNVQRAFSWFDGEARLERAIADNRRKMTRVCANCGNNTRLYDGDAATLTKFCQCCGWRHHNLACWDCGLNMVEDCKCEG